MKSHKIALKLYLSSAAPPAAKLVEVFHEWVRDQALGGTLIDVVDYGHVHQGPHVLLVGHEADYALDFGEGRPGLLFVRKRVTPDVEAERLSNSFERLLGVVSRLEKEPRLAPLAFARTEVQLKVLDRLAAPNTKATFDAERAEIEAVAKKVLGGEVTVAQEGADSREPFTVRVKRPDA
jgi:hypothetical protein